MFVSVYTIWLINMQQVLHVTMVFAFAELLVQVEKSGLEEVYKGKDKVLAAKEQEIAAKDRALADERQRMSSLTDEWATLKGRLEGKTEEIESLQAHSRTLQG